MATYLQPEQPSLLSVFGREESQVLNFHVELNHIASMLQYHLICSVNLSDMNGYIHVISEESEFEEIKKHFESCSI